MRLALFLQLCCFLCSEAAASVVEDFASFGNDGDGSCPSLLQLNAGKLGSRGKQDTSREPRHVTHRKLHLEALKRTPGHDHSARNDTALVQRRSSRPCTTPGARAWIVQPGLDFIAEKIEQAFKTGLRSPHAFEDISGEKSGFNYALKNMRLVSASVSWSKLDFVANGGLWLRMGGIDVKFLMDYFIEGSDWWNPIYSSGDVDAQLLSPSTHFEAHVRPYVNANGDLQVSIEDVAINVDFQVTVPGLFIGNLIETIIWVADKVLRSQIEDMLANIITDLDTTFLNDALAGMAFQLPLGLAPPNDGMTLNFAVCSIVTTGTYLSFDVSGETFDSNDPALSYPKLPLAISSQPPSQDTMMAIALTKWTVNSALWMLDRKGFFDFAPSPEKMPKKLRELSTKDLVAAAPRLLFKPKRNVTLSMSSMEPPDVAIGGSINISAPLNLTFSSVESDGSSKLLFSLKAPLLLSAQVIVTSESPQKVTPKLAALSFTPVEVLEETDASGKVQAAAASWILKMMEAGYVKMIRKHLGDGVEMSVHSGFGLTDLTVDMADVLYAFANIRWDF